MSEKKIGKHIKEVRIKQGLSQEKLADMCGFSNTTLSSYENGRKNPSLDTVAIIAKKLKVSIEHLYYGDENSSFIEAEPDEGRKIVNAVYYLWKSGVITYYDNPISGEWLSSYEQHVKLKGFYLHVFKFEAPVKRLIRSLNEYREKEKTYENPETYLELILSSVANEINDEIPKEREIRVITKKES
jgi:transcriptional regulator with XRE-family HTH domain